MSNREDLLAGAKKCLHEKGYHRTTARDVAKAAGVSLAAIGYHFGTKEALLNAALRQTLEEWGDEIAGDLTGETDSRAESAEQFQATWDRVIRSLPDTRRLWAVQFEVLAGLEGNPELRRTFAEAGRQARLGLAELFGSTDERDGMLYQTMLMGLAAQWLLDPETAPSGGDLLDAMRALVARLGS